MKVIIQCCSSKHESYWYSQGDKIIFVANPDMCDGKSAIKYCLTGQRLESNGLTWQEKLEEYNNQEGNPDKLKKAGELYKPKIYSDLIEHFGLENVFILSAGWGLVRADFYLPAYDITFSYQKGSDKFKQRKYKKGDEKFADFNHLDCPDDETIYFFGGTDYLDMYYDLTRELPCPKVICYKAAQLDFETNRVKGYSYIKYETARVQNWHYSCAKDFMAEKDVKVNSLCEKLHEFTNNYERHYFPFDSSKLPLNGIYILFEKGEKGHGLDRIVRIGTHTGDNNLQARLEEHFITENKDRSIFRKNIGRAILNKGNDAFLEKWEICLTSKEEKEKNKNAIDFGKQKEIEKQVSKYIQESFSFIVLDISDKEARLHCESKFIATIAQCKDCKPSNNWLGEYSPKLKIRESGLWQEQKISADPFIPEELSELITLIPLDENSSTLPYLKIVEDIKNNLTGNKESDMTCLINEAGKWAGHDYEVEIRKEIFRMIARRLPNDEKQILADDITNFRSLVQVTLNDVKSKILDGMIGQAEKIIKALFDENIVPAEEMHSDDKVTAYFSFNNIMELFYYQWKYKPEKKIILNRLIDYSPYLSFAYLLIEKKDYDKALEFLDRGLRWNPLETNLLFEKSEIYKNFKDWDMYKKINHKCWEYSYTPKSLARVFRNYGYMFTEQKDFDGAISCYLHSLNFEYSYMATHELYYITQSTRKVIDEEFYQKNCRTILNERDIPYAINKDILVFANTMAKSTHDKKDFKGAHYFYNILWNLTKDERIREILIDLNNHIIGQHN